MEALLRVLTDYRMRGPSAKFWTERRRSVKLKTWFARVRSSG
jgi:hypothetical protein